MRKLKFRIWDRQSKRFVGNDAGTHCASRWLIDAFTGRPVDFVVGFEDPEFGSLSEGENYYIEGTKVVKEPRYAVQQFSDILDKNGVEIYEGDVLRYESSRKGVNNTIVRWADEQDDCYPRLKISDSYSQYGEPEVIGNIFENPELNSILDSSVASLKEGKASEPVDLTKFADE